MKDFACIYGSKEQGLELNCLIENNGVILVSIALLLFGVKEYINIQEDVILSKLESFCLLEYNRQQKYRRIEKAFKERLGETIDIDNEESYNIATYEWMKKTGDDNNMNDLNGDLKAFG